jgi:uncharacterized Rmd1/YagE family protein
MSPDESNQCGRVSVYCVGDSINIKALRAHIFRRGFGANKELSNGTQAPLSLARSSALENEDDEVLHVSNAPLFIAISSNDNDQSSNTDSYGMVAGLTDEEIISTESISSGELSNDLSKTWGARETVLMATQDVFYFDYGCVVFWGLTLQEERAAMTELIPFSFGNISTNALEESFDTLEYIYDKKANPKRPIRSDRIRLRSLQLEEKLAFSYAMAQSSRLYVFETRVLNAVEGTRYLPKELAIHGRISSSKRDLNKLIGQLFAEQTEVKTLITDAYIQSYHVC